MDVIIFQNGLYYVYTIATVVSDCFNYCDIFREEFTNYVKSVNQHVMKHTQGIFFGCICK